MEGALCRLNYGLVLLSEDLRVVGVNDYARQSFGPALADLGKSLFHYHPRKSREQVRGILREMVDSSQRGTGTMVIDVLGKAILCNLSRVTMTSATAEVRWAVTFADVTVQTGAAVNPLSGLVEMKKIPIVEERGTYGFLALEDVLCVQSDGDYCKVFTAAHCHLLHLSLKAFLQRYPFSAFFRVHKSFVVNLAHVSQTQRAGTEGLTLVLDAGDLPPVPVARRKAAELKRALNL